MAYQREQVAIKWQHFHSDGMWLDSEPFVVAIHCPAETCQCVCLVAVPITIIMQDILHRSDTPRNWTSLST